MRRWHFWIVVYLSAASVLTLMRYIDVDRHHYRDREEEHARILKGEAERPINIRVLQPLLVEAFASRLPFFSREARFQGGYCAIRWISLAVLFVAFETFVLGFADLQTARLATLLLAAMLPLSFAGYYYQPTGVLDSAAFAVGLVLVTRGWFWPAVALVAVATMNRNTAIFIVGAWFLWRMPEAMGNRRKALLLFVQSAALGACWLATVAILGRVYPAADWVKHPVDFLRYNLGSKRGLLMGAIMFFPLVVSLVYGWKRVASRGRLLALLAVPYVVLHVSMGHIDKVRYWVNLYLMLAPFLAAAYRRYAGDPGPLRGDPS